MSRHHPGGSSNSSSSKLRMDRQPAVARISDPSLPMGRRKEIDSVMKKARGSGNGNTGDYWDKKLLDIEEKDPSRWHHSGFKKMYLNNDSSPETNQNQSGRVPRERDRVPPRAEIPPHRQRPRSPPPRDMRRRSPHPSEMPPMRRRSPPPQMMMDKRGPAPGPVRGSRRPPSPPPKFQPRHRSKSSDSSYSGDYPHHGRDHHHHRHHPAHAAPSSSSAAAAALHHRERPGAHRSRSRSVSVPRTRPRSPDRRQPPMVSTERTNSSASAAMHGSRANAPSAYQSSSARDQEHNHHHRSATMTSARSGGGSSSAAVIGKTRPIPLEEDWKRGDAAAAAAAGKRTKKSYVPEDPRLARQAAASAAATSSSGAAASAQAGPSASSSGNGDSAQAAKKRSKGHEKLRARVKIEGEKRRKRQSSSESEDSSSSESASESIPTFAATTRMTLSERFGKMAQWSADRSNMDNLKTMRITKDSAGGPLKVMIEEQQAAAAAAMETALDPPPRREYSPAPVGHFPEELALTAPSGLMSWDDVRVRYEYYKARGYLRDLDLQDYVKWEEWWYKYQEWLKQERYYEFWERQQLRRRRKKLPIAQRLN